MSDIRSSDLPKLTPSTKQEQGAKAVVTRDARAESLPDIITQRVEQQRARIEAAATARETTAQQAVEKDLREHTSRGVTVEGRVIERLENGTYSVRTAEGDIIIQPERVTDIPRPNARVQVEVIEIRPDADSALIRVTSALSSFIETDLSVELRHADTPLQVDITRTTETAALPLPADINLSGTAIRIEAFPADLDLPPQTLRGEILPATLPPLTALSDSIRITDTGVSSAPLTERALKAVPTLQKTLSELVASALAPRVPVPSHISRLLIQPETIIQHSSLAIVERSGVLPLISTAPPVTTRLQAVTLSVPPALSVLDVQASAQKPIVATTQPTPPEGEYRIASYTPVGVKGDNSLFLTSIKAGEISFALVGQTPDGVTVARVSNAPPAQEMLNVLNTPPPTGGTEGLFLLRGALNIQSESGIITATPESAVSSHITQQALPSLPNGMPALPALAPYFLTTDTWPVMNDIHEALARVSPQAAQAFVATAPSATGNPAQIMPAVLFFMAAVRGGDFEQWLGDKNIELLKRASGGKALSALLSEGELLSRMANERSPSEWRSMPIPFYQDEQFKKVVLHLREEAYQQDDATNTGKNVRFIFDLALDHMGEVQLDGLFHSGGRLDLIVRTQQRFSTAMQQDMRQLYAGAIEQAGVHGELAFQNNLDQWVTIDYQDKNFGVSA